MKKVITKIIAVMICILNIGIPAIDVEAATQDKVSGRTMYTTSYTIAYRNTDLAIPVISNFEPGTKVNVSNIINVDGTRICQYKYKGKLLYSKADTFTVVSKTDNTKVRYKDMEAEYCDIKGAEEVALDIIISGANRIEYLSGNPEGERLMADVISAITSSGMYTYSQYNVACTNGNVIFHDYGTNDQEKKKYVDQMVEKIISSLNADSDYNKIKNVHDWICDNVKYSRETADDVPGYNYRTAYDALKDGTTVCSGYALLFQKFMEKMDIPSYIITSKTHAWNIVKIEGKWYLMDVTWDDSGDSYKYFLSGSEDTGRQYYGNIKIADKSYGKE